ncbi:MAG TPA: lyase family protein, partial [Negativicutes bacterium]|nr:lyase family protein [Negativicutes bacterium]
MRRDKDLLGERDLPDEAYYGVHTLRAAENFPLSGYRVHPRLIAALALIKKAAAEVNAEQGSLDADMAKAIGRAADEVMEGKWRDQFVVDALQGGAGTSTNMNVNEVLAGRANELLAGAKSGPVHPLDHVNLHQSTNDVYPTALRIAAVWLLQPLSEACAALQESLQAKETEFAGVIKVGRTQLQDALPIMLGQEFGAWAQAIARDRWRLYKVEERLRQTNLGGTAVGTGLNAPPKYINAVNERVRRYANIGLARAENMVDVTQNADVFVEVSGLVKALAVNLSKIAHDVRLLSSGPRAGLGEIVLPERQAGSSIMPGKVNPVIAEAVN